MLGVWHGPYVSHLGGPEADEPTAGEKTERFFLSDPPPQLGQLTESRLSFERISVSKLVLQSEHVYSKMGIFQNLFNPDFPLENFQGLKTDENLTGRSKLFD
jgi:hypothetical protein